ncbi:hypothetical protein B0I37DRAFT_383866 [Chaetomium sp. MPI-CAGE-AT-0009]|nr:hypothetical protein B0I37DRAFT_383866 [Chaetomium sp. MPI-CAGE-AT-0009]
MSGLEPVVALSLACNILQIIGVARETVSVARQVYQNGTLDPALTYHATTLDNLSQQIQSTFRASTTTTTARPVAATGVQTPTTPTARDRQLLDLADKCVLAAKALRDEVNFLSGPPTTSELVAILKIAAKTTWRKRRLDGLERKLGDAERLLQMGLLASIYERTERTGGGVEALDTALRSFLDEYRRGHTNTANATATDARRTRDHITVQVKKSEEAVERHITRETTQAETSLRTHITQTSAQAETSLSVHITQTSAQVEKSLRDRIGAAIESVAKREQDARLEARRERLLRSLKFDRMNERRSQVAASHPNTFQWVLRDHESDEGGSGEVAGLLTVGTEKSSGNLPGDDSDSSDWESDDSEEPNSSGSSSCSSSEGASWDSFPNWLRSREPVYWISGKPAAGKTTLIKYLLDHPQTQSFLGQRDPGTILISHFFWRPGTQMQQRIRGLLCSLLYQLLLQDNASVDRILCGNADTLSSKDVEADWSNEELQSTLHDIISHYPRPIVAFVDGLDEVHPKDGILQLLDLIDELVRSQAAYGKLKWCLGARREPLLQTRLSSCPQLRMENLNRVDLRRYARGNIIIPPGYQVAMHPDSTIWARTRQHPRGATFSCERLPSHKDIRDWLVHELVYKAQGVFLWLSLTAKTIVTALNLGETVDDVKQRVDNLPSDLAHLYTDMWSRMNGDGYHQTHAALYLQIVLCTNWAVPPLTMMIATDQEMADLIQTSKPPKDGLVTRLLESCKKTKQDVEIRCAGLLECTLPSDKFPTKREPHIPIPWYGDEYGDLAPYLSTHASFRFVHRTARDFLLDTVEGRKILAANTVSWLSTRLRVVEASLAAFSLLKMPPVIYDGRCHITQEESTLKRYLDAICAVLHELPAGGDSGLRAESERLLRLCEYHFNAGHLFGEDACDYSEHESGEFNKEFPVRDPRLRTCYEKTVHRQHEFLLEASANLGSRSIPWQFITTRVKEEDADKETLSQLLLNACNLEIGRVYTGRRLPEVSTTALEAILAVRDRLKLATVLLARGAYRSSKGPRRICDKEDHDDSAEYGRESPLERLLEKAWDASFFGCRSNLSTARDILRFIQLLICHGADPAQETLVLAYEIKDGRLVEGHPMVRETKQTAPPGPIEGAIFFITVSASTVISNLLRAWAPNSPERKALPGAQQIISSGAGPGRLDAILYLTDDDAREQTGEAPPESRIGNIIFLEPGHELDEELLWVPHTVQRMLQDSSHWAAKPHFYDGDQGFPVPIEVQSRIFRVLEQITSANDDGTVEEKVRAVIPEKVVAVLNSYFSMLVLSEYISDVGVHLA